MISSTSNAKVKRLVNLRKKRKLRDEEGVFLEEGIRMFREIPKELLLEIYVTEEFFEKEKALVEEMQNKSKASVEVLANHVFQYVSDTKTPQGVLCVVKQFRYTLEEFLSAKEEKAPFFMILDNLQDPGNLGTVIRSAEGAGATGVIMSKDCVDVYNPKVIRATMGSVYRVPFCYVEDLPETIGWLKEQGVSSYAAHLKGKHSYEEEDYQKPCAFLIGNEGNGLRDEVAESADIYVKIPMEGQVESLNAAIAATILMFEVARQRRHP